jgi:hypothetical protein
VLTDIRPGHQVACHFPLQIGETLLERLRELGTDAQASVTS